MKAFFRTVGSYLFPYKRNLVFNLLFNFLSAIFGVFSMITMIPLLKILFGLEQKVYGYISLREATSSMGALGNALKQNLYCLITQISDNQGPASALIYIGLFLVVMVFFKVGFTYLASYYLVFLRNSVVRDIRIKIYNKTVSLPVGFFTEERKGDIMARISVDVTEVETSIMSSLEMIFKNPIIIVVSIVTMFIMSWQLTLFVFVLFPIAGFVIGRVGKSLKRRSIGRPE